MAGSGHIFKAGKKAGIWQGKGSIRRPVVLFVSLLVPIDFFGLDGMDANWFVSVLERLKEISRESVKGIQGDKRKQEAIHYHDVKWGQCNIPIQRSDLISLPKDIRENDLDYPIYQFSISKARGRIAGFWEDGNVFNVVLFDPYHNLQPSKDYDYRVTPTKEMLNEHEWLIAKLHLIKSAPSNCSGGQCSTQQALKFINLHDQPFGILYVDAEYFKKAIELVENGKAKSVEELLELGILQKC